MERLRSVNIMDKITPAQGEAWELEHEAILAPELAKGYYRALAFDIREGERLEHKRLVYSRGDEQNELLDEIARIKDMKNVIPVFELAITKGV